MNNRFSMAEAVQQTEHLLVALGNARSRAMRHRDNLAVLDARIGFFRLLTTVILLAVLVSVTRQLETTQQFLAWIGFIFLFLIASILHKRLQAKLKFWKSVVQSIELSEARIKRDAEAFRASSAPWHTEVAKDMPRGHIYATDLDVGSQVFDLLDTCVTKDGSRKLFSLLLNAGVEEIQDSERRGRMHRARFLSKKSKVLRRMEALRLNEDYIAEYVQQEGEKAHRTETEEQSVLGISPLQGFLVAGAGIAAWLWFVLPALLRFFETGDAEALFMSVIKYLIVPLLGVGIFAPLVRNAHRMGRQTKILMEMLRHMRSVDKDGKVFSFKSLSAHPENNIRGINLGVDLLTLRGNPVLWVVLHVLLPFDSLLCLFVLLQMKKVAPHINVWWSEAVEFDVDCSLATFARENPTLRFVDENEEKEASPERLHAEDMGHPLLAASQRVCNSFDFTKGSPLVLLTGSNMAGKSTFLRTLGLNMMLFNLGAPVCAARFVTAPHRLLCAIRVDDSLSEGTSYFYAEVKRLKAILEFLTSGKPALFLVDEIFRGTNNKERFQGSWHILQALLKTQAFGIVSTHDLALADLANEDSRLRNMHFREHVEEGRLVFDYKLREGKCPTTNALHIMRDAGLPIPENLS